VLNWIFAALIIGSVLFGAFTGTLKAVTDASSESAKTAVTLAIGLVGQMALWLGFMGVLKEAGLLTGLARALKPVMTRLFPSVPPEHPAMGAMIMNIAANVLGLGNAATPFGLKAMRELDMLNSKRGVATDAMALFLVINTSGVAVLPLGVVAIRAGLGSTQAASIVLPSLIGTFVSTVFAVLICKAYQRLPLFSAERVQLEGPVAQSQTAEEPALPAEVARPPVAAWRWALIAGVVTALATAIFHQIAKANGTGLETARLLLDIWILPLLMVGILLVGIGRQVKVYEAFIAAAKEGFSVAVTIIPYLVAIIVGIGMFRASGAMDLLTSWLGPLTEVVGLPAEALPMALIRPLSGSGATGVMTEAMKTYHPDSYVGVLVSLINGSSETTFYVLAVYFGVVQVRAVRHTLAACLTSDIAGLLLTVQLARLFFSHLPRVGAP
jgi:spore maturation protein SpmA